MTSPKALAEWLRSNFDSLTITPEDAKELATHLDRLTRIDDATQDVAEIRTEVQRYCDAGESSAWLDRIETLLAVVDRMAGEIASLGDAVRNLSDKLGSVADERDRLAKEKADLQTTVATMRDVLRAKPDREEVVRLRAEIERLKQGSACSLGIAAPIVAGQNCNGSVALGNGCTRCRKCQEEMNQIAADFWAKE